MKKNKNSENYLEIRIVLQIIILLFLFVIIIMLCANFNFHFSLDWGGLIGGVLGGIATASTAYLTISYYKKVEKKKNQPLFIKKCALSDVQYGWANDITIGSAISLNRISVLISAKHTCYLNQIKVYTLTSSNKYKKIKHIFSEKIILDESQDYNLHIEGINKYRKKADFKYLIEIDYTLQSNKYKMELEIINDSPSQEVPTFTHKIVCL